MQDLIDRFTSRKFLLALLGVVMVFGLELDGAQISAITALIVAFTAAQGTTEAIAAYRGNL